MCPSGFCDKTVPLPVNKLYDALDKQCASAAVAIGGALPNGLEIEDRRSENSNKSLHEH